MTGSDIQRFQAMVDAYRRLAGQSVQAREAQRARFTAFCEQGRALLGQRVEGLAIRTQWWRERLGGSWPVFDLFEALGISGKENRYTDLLAWLCQVEGGVGKAFVGSGSHPDQAAAWT